MHPGGRYLQYADGRPFFYLGDTAWELFHRTTREEARLYLEDRARKGFTVIQAVCLAERDGLRVPNAYGALPFADAGCGFFIRAVPCPGRVQYWWSSPSISSRVIGLRFIARHAYQM